MSTTSAFCHKYLLYLPVIFVARFLQHGHRSPVVVCLILGACGRIDVESLPIDTGAPGVDTIIPSDTGMLPDGGPDSDDSGDVQVSTQTETLSDENLPTDSETRTDTSAGSETEAPTDSETTTKTAQPSDSGIPSDTGMPTDTSVATDTETPTDTEAPTDTAVPTDSETTTVPECESTYSDALVCTGFEDGITLDTHNIWQGDLAVATDPVFNGEASLHAYTTEDESYANVTGVFPPIFAGPIYFRAYYYIPAGVITGLIKLAAFDAAGGSSHDDELNVDFIVLAGGSLQVHLHEQAAPNDFESEAGVVPEDAWFCLRGGIDISDDAGSVTLSIGDTEWVSVIGLDTLSPSGVSYADFGVGWTEGVANGAEVFVDNIVVDTVPIPCI